MGVYIILFLYFYTLCFLFKYKTYKQKTVVSYCILLSNYDNFIFINPVSLFQDYLIIINI